MEQARRVCTSTCLLSMLCSRNPSPFAHRCLSCVLCPRSHLFIYFRALFSPVSWAYQRAMGRIAWIEPSRVQTTHIINAYRSTFLHPSSVFLLNTKFQYSILPFCHSATKNGCFRERKHYPLPVHSEHFFSNRFLILYVWISFCLICCCCPVALLARFTSCQWPATNIYLRWKSATKRFFILLSQSTIRTRKCRFSHITLSRLLILYPSLFGYFRFCLHSNKNVLWCTTYTCGPNSQSTKRQTNIYGDANKHKLAQRTSPPSGRKVSMGQINKQTKRHSWQLTHEITLAICWNVHKNSI